MPNPWTLLSHQSKEKIKKSLKMPIKKYQAKKEEKSTRMRRLNYKPSNRYNISFLSNSETTEELIVLCENCANLYLNNNHRKNSNSSKKISFNKNNSTNHVNVDNKNKKFPISKRKSTKLGPIQRSHYVRNNVSNLITHRENTIKLCQLNRIKFDFTTTANYQKDRFKFLNRNKREKRKFDIIKHNNTKFSSLQLKDSKLMLNLLKK